MKIFLWAIVLLTIPCLASAQDARVIADKAYNRNDGKTMVGKQTLSTCRYATKNQQPVCAETPRIKTFEIVRKDFGAAEKDKKSISIVVEPQGEKGISFLQYDYEDLHKNSDQWIYLSAYKKVKRIVSAGKDEPKTGSYFGSELSYEDIERHQVDNYTYQMLKSEVYNGRDCWVIVSVPKPQQAKKSSYSKSILWIDKERDLILKAELYDKNGDLFKQNLVVDVSRVNGVWTIEKSIMKNVQTKRMTSTVVDKVTYNVEVSDLFLSQRTLTDMAFRESRMEKYRKIIVN